MRTVEQHFLLYNHQPEALCDPKISAKLYGLTDGNIGTLIDLLRRAAVDSIRTGSERITLKQLRTIRRSIDAEGNQAPDAPGDEAA